MKGKDPRGLFFVSYFLEMLFDKRENLKPYEYDVMWYADAILHSFWLKSEYNYTSDIQDYEVNMTPQEKEAVKRCMLAISTIEVKVKSFWWDIGKHIPKPEFANVGAVFWCNEVIHLDFYAHLLDLLNLNDEFIKVLEVPALKSRIDYIAEQMNNPLEGKEHFLHSIIAFTLFVENVSLFSQFLVLMSINKHKGYLKGMSNGIMASSKEEAIHSMFWAEIINIVAKEYPEMYKNKGKIVNMALDFINIEKNIVNWIFEEWELGYINKEDMLQYVNYRMKKGLDSIGITSNIDWTLPETLEWFELELKTTTHVDFFNKKSVNYTKKQQSITEEDLF